MILFLQFIVPVQGVAGVKGVGVGGQTFHEAAHSRGGDDWMHAGYRRIRERSGGAHTARQRRYEAQEYPGR
jgi:hypothetical protein